MKRNRKRSITGILLLFVFFFAFKITEIDIPLFIERKSQMTLIFKQMFPPDWSFYQTSMKLLLSTIVMSIAGTVSGAILAMFSSFLCSRQFGPGKGLILVFRCINNLIRTVPVLILALFATFLFGIGTFAGTAAIFLYSLVILTRIGYEDLDSKDYAAYNALHTAGISSGKVFVRTVLTEFLPGYLSNALYLLESNVRQATILGYVGAGGIGLLLNEKIAWREYAKVGMILILLYLVVLLLELLSTLLLKERKLKGITFGLGFLLYLVSISYIQFPGVQSNGLKVLSSLLHGLIHPDWSLIFTMSSEGIPYMMMETICIALLGTAIGAIIAFVLSFFASTKLMPEWIYIPVRMILTAIRTIPVLIYGFLFIRVVGPGSYAGVLTLSTASIGLLSKRFLVAIDSLDYDTYYGIGAMGIDRKRLLIRVLLPELFPHIMSAACYRFDVNMREASILGIVGAGGIGAPLIFAVNNYHWNQVGAFLVSLIVLLFFIDFLSSKMRADTI